MATPHDFNVLNYFFFFETAKPRPANNAAKPVVTAVVATPVFGNSSCFGSSGVLVVVSAVVSTVVSSVVTSVVGCGTFLYQWIRFVLTPKS